MSDFIREVDEDYRRDRVVAFLTKYQILLIGLAVAIVAGAGGYRVYRDHETRVAEAANLRFEAAVDLAAAGKGAEAEAAFDAIQAGGPSGYAMLARMRAVEALATRDPAAAARGFDAIAQDETVEQSLREVAQFRGALIRIDSDEPKAFEARYAPLAAGGFAFRSSLRELLALAALKRNDTEAAGRWLDEIVVDRDAPRALRSRAEAFLSLVAAGPVASGTPAPPKPVIPPAPDLVPLAPPVATAPDQAAPAEPPPAPAPEAAKQAAPEPAASQAAPTAPEESKPAEPPPASAASPVPEAAKPAASEHTTAPATPPPAAPGK